MSNAPEGSQDNADAEQNLQQQDEGKITDLTEDEAYSNAQILGMGGFTVYATQQEDGSWSVEYCKR